MYEYFLGQFATAEGKKGGQFYTPAHVVKTLVAVLAPHKGRVYDPCCGSGGMFVQSERFVAAHGGKRDDISIYGQESNPTTWRLAAMNLAIHGLAGNLGQGPADTFGRDQFPDQKFDTILANPPFNVSDWGGEKYGADPRWVYGRPPAGNANYAWLQHMLWKLGPGGEAGVVLANTSMNSDQSGAGQIRKAMVRQDVVEAMVALPGQLFLNTSISVCLWFLTKDKTSRGRDRRGETLFIDARQLGTMVTQVQRILTDADIARIADTVHAWRADGEVEQAYRGRAWVLLQRQAGRDGEERFCADPWALCGNRRRPTRRRTICAKDETPCCPTAPPASRGGTAGCRHCRQPGQAGVWRQKSVTGGG